MLIGFDIRRAGGFGVGTYIKNLLRSLARIGPEHEYVLIGGRPDWDHFRDLGENFRFALYERPWDSPRSHVEYGFFIRRLGLDIFHMPHRWVPLFTPGPYVATLHDLNNIFFPPAPGPPIFPPGQPPEGGVSVLGRTTGFGDLTYLGLFGPKNPPKLGGGSLLVAIGPTLQFPTASEKPLGSEKYSAGMGGLLAYLGKKWKVGALPMQFWSYSGPEMRADVSVMNLQYFVYYSINPEWSIGISPNVMIDWNQSKGNKLSFPTGIGFSNTRKIGKVPVRFGVEMHHYVWRPDNVPGGRWGIRFYMMPAMPAFMFGL